MLEAVVNSKPEAGQQTAREYRFVHRAKTGPALPYHLYLPSQPATPQRVLVAVHGISRNVEQHLAAMRPWAERYGVVLILPHYDRCDFRDYQRLGRTDKGARADLPLLGVLDEVHAMFGIDTRRVGLFGFSGGAQFAHRFALFHAQRVSRLGLAAAGWYTWPEPRLDYPLGVGRVTALPGVQMQFDAMLAIPIQVFVGEHDDQRDRALNTLAAIDRLQGRDRRARAVNWVAAMCDAAAQRAIAADVRLQVLPRTHHSFRKAVTRGQLIERLFRSFYE